MNKILVVGQTPPPFGGQAIMIEQMLAGHYPDARLYHVRMNYSGDMNEVGRFKIGKVFHLFALIFRTYALALSQNIRILYYPPAGPDMVPVLRDIVFLVAVRWLFTHRIFQFHAAGLAEFYDRGPPLLRWFMEIAYFKPDIAICQSSSATQDGRVLRAKAQYVIPHGIEDHGQAAVPKSVDLLCPTILYVGVLREDKGTMVLLEACRKLRQRGHAMNVKLMGSLVSPQFEAAVRNAIQQFGLEDTVSLCGVLTGDAKWQVFGQADIFCFPTYFPSESFGVCLIEAESFGLPVVATQWRGIPEVVDDGRTGILVPPQDAEALAEALGRLISEPELRLAMGAAGRRKFEREFTLTQYYNRLNALFRSIGRGESATELTPSHRSTGGL